jgi:hypothetical protein
MLMPDLGTQWPSQLLAAMLEWCPRGEETSSFFITSFLCRLPNELRVLQGHDDFKDLKAVSEKADVLWQLCPHANPHAAVAELEKDLVAPLAGVGQWSKDRSAGSQEECGLLLETPPVWGEGPGCADPATCISAGN